jgi:hypothetical protein
VQLGKLPAVSLDIKVRDIGACFIFSNYTSNLLKNELNKN